MLHDELKNLNKYPFHMPGHKRNPDFKINASEIDITEIKGFDNLHSPCGCISDTEHELERLYNSKRTFMLVNGSTVGILAAIFSFTKENDTVIIARNCHKSVYNAAFLRKLKIAYIEPEFDFKHGFYKGITQEAVHRAEKKFPQAKALVITSPTYEGYVSEIKSSLPVIVDAAHGAHSDSVNFPIIQKATR
ncbi:MAG: hypothetical protein LUG21_08040 [Clostridiales bacterium]|nr:hypothetical protein [Clostridiales bacterium]